MSIYQAREPTGEGRDRNERESAGVRRRDAGAYILGVPLAENVVRQWPQMDEIVRTRKRLYRNVTIGELEDGQAVRVTDY